MSASFRKVFAILCFLFPLLSNSQNSAYFQSRNYQKALQDQTRSLSGLPGPAYWQNSAKYSIDVSYDPQTNMLSGKAEIAYLNNSPDELNQLVFNIYQDIFRKGNSRDWDLGMGDLHQGTVINRLRINDEEFDVNNTAKIGRNGTKLIVKPEVKIPKKDSALIFIDWEVKLPAQRTVRMGKYSDSIVFVAYWYPQIAVYDDIDGWDMIPYNGSVEFYNDWNDYDVRITVPNNYGVWATGLLQNPDEVFQAAIAERYRRALTADDVVQIIHNHDYRQNKVFKQKKSSKTLTYHFKAEQVPDFSFGTGLELNWDGVSVVVDHQSQRRVLADAVYPQTTLHYDKVADYSRQSIDYMSHTMPGIAFPWPQMTTMSNGRRGGGMETPMMAINGVPASASGNFGLTFHEIAHTYMPFYLGTNEKKYAWMDEGWATLWPHKLVDSIFENANYLKNLMEGYEKSAGFEMDIPPMIPNQLMGSAYSSLRLASYIRPAVAYYFLEQELGNELFSFALRSYMNIWAGKHPLPHDFFHLFETATDRNLSWFFLPWFYEFAYPDLSIKKVTNDGKIVIQNTGGLPLPVELAIAYTDDSTERFYYPSSIWATEDKVFLVETSGQKKIREISLGNELIPDTNRKDNSMLIID